MLLLLLLFWMGHCHLVLVKIPVKATRATRFSDRWTGSSFLFSSSSGAFYGPRFRQTDSSSCRQEGVLPNHLIYEIRLKKKDVSVGHVWLKFHPSIFLSPLLRVTGALEHIAAVSRGEAGPHPGQVDGLSQGHIEVQTSTHAHICAFTQPDTHAFGSEHPGENWPRRR